MRSERVAVSVMSSRRRGARRPGGAAGRTAVAVVCLSLGCDIVQGFDAAAGAIFPDQPTSVNAPGFRLAAGGYAELDAVQIQIPGGIGFVLLARSADPLDASLSVIRFGDGRACRIESVGAYKGHPLREPGEAMLSYVEGPSDTLRFTDPNCPIDASCPSPRTPNAGGTLRFADSDCRVLPAEVPEATLPFASRGDGRHVAFSRDDLVLVDPGSGAVEPLEQGVERAVVYPNASRLVLAGGRLGVYDNEWTLEARLGAGVVTARYLHGTVVFEDGTGIWTYARSGEPSLISRDGCGLGFPRYSTSWITFRAPCRSGRFVALRLDPRETIDLGEATDATHLEFWADASSSNGSFWLAYVRDYDEAEGLGVLVLRSPDGAERVLGRRAAPEWTTHSSIRTGSALVDIDGFTGTLVAWDTTSVRPVAERVLREYRGTGLLVNFDGMAGDLAGMRGLGSVEVLLHRVPASSPIYFSDRGVGAVLTDFDGRIGTLSEIDSSLQKVRDRATKVIHPKHGFIDALFPGMAWIRSDGSGTTGTLEYQNDELGYTAVVSHGVASLLSTNEGIIYSMPRGEGAGIWFAEAR